MATLGEAKVNIRANLRPLRMGLKKARLLVTKSMKSLAGGVIGGIGRVIKSTVRTVITSVRRMVRIVTVALLAIGVASVKMAADAEESENLFDVSMGKMRDSVRAWSEVLSKALKLNAFEVRKMVSTFNIMLLSMGLGEKKAAEMSKQLTTLALDMASFFNLRPEEAFQKIQAGITGEIEPLKRLGILINETTIKTHALNTGLIQEGETLTEVQKVLARYQVLLKQTGKAQGDMERTLNSTTNVFRSIRSVIADVAISIGNVLKPQVTAVAIAFREWLVNNKKQIIEWTKVIQIGINIAVRWITKLFSLFTGGQVNKAKKMLNDLWNVIKAWLQQMIRQVQPIAEQIGIVIGKGMLKGIGIGLGALAAGIKGIITKGFLEIGGLAKDVGGLATSQGTVGRHQVLQADMNQRLLVAVERNTKIQERSGMVGAIR